MTANGISVLAQSIEEKSPESIYSFVTNCLHVDWTSAITPLNNLGIKLGLFVEDKRIGDEVIRKIRITEMCKLVVKVVLGLDSAGEDCAEKLMAMDEYKVCYFLYLNKQALVRKIRKKKSYDRY